MIVIGSQAPYGSIDDLPEVGTRSMEVDLLLQDEHDRDDVAGLFGELSRFHETWGVYADPVDIRTGRFPSGWLDRLISVPVGDPTRSRTYLARCVELHDLVVAKLVAGRDKDREMITELFTRGRISLEILAARLENTELTDVERASVATRLAAWTAQRG